jgi:hypothetical protein
MGPSVSETSPSYELPHALSPDQDTTSGLFVHQRHWLADRVRAHVFLCMLAYYLEWHMRRRGSEIAVFGLRRRAETAGL